MAFAPGKDSHVTIAGTLQFGSRVEHEEEAGLLDVTNFESPTAVDGSKYREFLGGFINPNFQLEGVLDPGQAQPIRGSLVTWSWLIGGGHTISGNMIVQRLRRFTDIDNAARYAITGKPTGPPTIT